MKPEIWYEHLPRVVGYPIGWYINFEDRASLGPFESKDEALKSLQQRIEQHGSPEAVADAIEKESVKFLAEQFNMTVDEVENGFQPRELSKKERILAWLVSVRRKLSR